MRCLRRLPSSRGIRSKGTLSIFQKNFEGAQFLDFDPTKESYKFLNLIFRRRGRRKI